MEQRFIVILNFDPQSGEILKIRLSDEELAESEKYEDMESYLSTLEEKYEFDLSLSKREYLDIKKNKWYHEVDCSKEVSLIIDKLNKLVYKYY